MIILQNVSKKFGTGEFGLSDITFAVEKGEFAFLIGPTGSGKTTIFRMLIREMLPTQGTIIVNDLNLLKLKGSKIPDLRKKIGVVFQDLKLLPDRTVLENTTLPLELSGFKPKEAKKKAEEVLELVGISEHANKFPIQLSGGGRQRAAIARAISLSPEILLADEPTGDLDDEAAWGIVELLKNINEAGTTIIMATHNSEIVKKLDKRIIELNKGILVNDKGGHKVKSAEDKVHENIDEKKDVSAEKQEEKKPEPAKADNKKDITDDFDEVLKEK